MSIACFRRWRWIYSAGICSAVWCGACGGTTEPAQEPALVRSVPIEFEYENSHGEVFSSESTRGRVTAVALVTMYDMGSQLLLRRLNEAVRAHRPRVNAGAVVLEAPNYEVLLDTFAETLELPFPVVLSDLATREGRGPFGDVDYLPILIVLDVSGRAVFRQIGPVETTVIFDAFRAAASEGSPSVP